MKIKEFQHIQVKKNLLDEINSLNYMAIGEFWHFYTYLREKMCLNAWGILFHITTTLKFFSPKFRIMDSV